jgi:hypothetical protein
MSVLTDRLARLNKLVVSFINSASDGYLEAQLTKCNDLIANDDLSQDLKNELLQFNRETYAKMVSIRETNMTKQKVALLKKHEVELAELEQGYADANDTYKKLLL